MSYKTILVHLGGEATFESVLMPALDLAQRFEAHLIGLSVTPPFVFQPSVVPRTAALLGDEHRKAFVAEAARLKPRFEAAAREAGVHAEWVDEDAGLRPVWKSVVGYGRAVDLIVAAAPKGEGTEEIVLRSGRPVLFVPEGPPRSVGRWITVAWNGRREGTRAAFDALPLLRKAQDVKVVWINPQDDDEMEAVPTGDLCTALARHGAPVEAVEVRAADDKFSEALTEYLHRSGSDLLVMGCYGHSRLREFVLGGATRRLLAALPAPVLMSH